MPRALMKHSLYSVAANEHISNSSSLSVSISFEDARVLNSAEGEMMPSTVVVDDIQVLVTALINTINSKVFALVGFPELMI